MSILLIGFESFYLNFALIQFQEYISTEYNQSVFWFIFFLHLVFLIFQIIAWKLEGADYFIDMIGMHKPNKANNKKLESLRYQIPHILQKRIKNIYVMNTDHVNLVVFGDKDKINLVLTNGMLSNYTPLECCEMIRLQLEKISSKRIEIYMWLSFIAYHLSILFVVGKKMMLLSSNRYTNQTTLNHPGKLVYFSVGIIYQILGYPIFIFSCLILNILPKSWHFSRPTELSDQKMYDRVIEKLKNDLNKMNYDIPQYHITLAHLFLYFQDPIYDILFSNKTRF
jgi:hypothetical protein